MSTLNKFIFFEQGIFRDRTLRLMVSSPIKTAVDVTWASPLRSVERTRPRSQAPL